MACSRCYLPLGLSKVVVFRAPVLSRHVNTTAVLLGKRRKEPALRRWGLEKFPREDRSRQLSPLIDLPDYTFLDGRPTPLTKQQLEKKEKNYRLAKRIVRLVKELEEAKVSHQQRAKEEGVRRESIITSKLQQKSEEL